MQYPIENEDMMNNLKKRKQNLNLNLFELRKRDLDYYKIINPIFNYEQVHIFRKSISHGNSKIVADHFDDMEYLNLLIR
jgi:hypothetical protein